MKTPESLETLVDYGIIQEVIRPLMSGKEAHVFVVVTGGEECVAKVYKEANQRTFKHRVEYTEGRRTRNSRDQRAMNKRTRHGRKRDEAAWRNAEVDTIYRLQSGGVRVPEPINYVDGVLVMELVRDAHGNPAPRLGDLEFQATEAVEIYQKLIREVVRMLCAGVIHGDLSEFNVLMGADGPVVIDFPQSVDPAKNQSARKLLLRDVQNLHRFLGRHAPNRAIHPYAEEMWKLYETNRLDPETDLTGKYVAPVGETNMDEVLALIEDANQDERMRRDARGDETPLIAPPSPVRRVVDFTKESKTRPGARKPGPKTRAARPKRTRNPVPEKPDSAEAGSDKAEAAMPPKRRSRRRRAGRSGSGREANASTEATEKGKPRGSSGAVPIRPRDKPDSEERSQPSRRRRKRRSTATPAGPADEQSTSKAASRPPLAPASSRSKSKKSVSPEKGTRPPQRRRRRRPSAPDRAST